jgi:hypothetical protein
MENATFLFEKLAKGPKIVDLAVKSHYVLAVSAQHGLRTRLRQVDDRKTAVAEPNPTVG